VRSSPIQAFWGARSTSASVGTISKFLRWFKKNCKISIDRGEQRLFFSTLIWINLIFRFILKPNARDIIINTVKIKAYYLGQRAEGDSFSQLSVGLVSCQFSQMSVTPGKYNK